MDTQIFLQGFKGKSSSNTSEGLDVQLKGKRRLLPFNELGEVISQNEQYLEERKKCNIIRLTCQVNPICSNVLFNRVSEIVKDEGSSAVTFLNYGMQKDEHCFDNVLFKKHTMEFWSGGSMNYQRVDEKIDALPKKWEQRLDAIYFNEQYHVIGDYNTDGEIVQDNKHVTNAIRDTQLSNSDNGFVYHCGLDILNNHLIRSNTFKCVCRCFSKSSDYETHDYTAFNTLADLMRNVEGRKVIEKLYFPVDAKELASEKYTKLIPMHLYEYDDVYTFDDCIKNRLIGKFTGWFGFENRSKIKSYLNFKSNFSMESGDTEMKIERPIMYYGGEYFVDMYPSRDLYSFVPKYNDYQRRAEKNWNYCITYPSSSYTPSFSTKSNPYTQPFSDIIESANGINTLKTVYIDENTRADNGVTQLVMYSVSKHGLSVGDFVNIYKTYTTYLYWVSKVVNVTNEDGLISTTKERVSLKFEKESEANDEMKLFVKSDKDGSYEVEKTSKEVTVSHKIMDNAEVSNIGDEYIFTLYNSNVQISNYWVYLADSEKEDEAEVDVSMRLDDGTEVTNTYKIDPSKKFFINKTDPHDDFKYYIVNEAYVNFDKNAQQISYKKVVSDVECDYYIRIFSKLPNFKFASGDTSTEYEIYRDRGNGNTMLETYQDKKYDFENHIGNLAFAENIYTDEVGELVFTDDIDISNIHDNLGRPLTSIYLTFIKNNKGYKEWYGYDHKGQWKEEEINTEFKNVEYSHCFGKVTCGLETSYESIYEDFSNSIHRINNGGATSQIGYNTDVINGERSYYTSIEDGINEIDITNNEIWYDTDKHFYGDLCCYDAFNCNEEHIQYVNHRFNSSQRESIRSQSSVKEHYFDKYYYDEITKDDYDNEPYHIESYSVDDANNMMEGYYYNPHYEIPIKTFDKLQSVMPDFLTIREMKKANSNVGEYVFTTLQQHFLKDGDKAMLYDTIRNKYYVLLTVSGNTDNFKVFRCKVYDEKTNEKVDITYLDAIEDEYSIEMLSTKNNIGKITVNSFKLFKIDNLDVPSYARVIKDGTCAILWRNVLNNGFDESNKIVEEYPFTNGAFYINKRIDIYVRRQDPYNEYGLFSEGDIKGNITDFTKQDNYIKDVEIEC